MRFFKRKDPTPSLDSIRFDSTGYEANGEPQPGRQRVWFTPEGDGVGLFLFTLPPDLPHVDSVDALRGFYAKQLKSAGGDVVEIAVLRIGEVPVVQLLWKLRQQPSGMTYLGAMTIPYRDFSFVVKVQCQEHGVTGIREAVLMDRRLAAGDRPTMLDGRMELSGWAPDAAEFDADFRSHPVSRARRVLERMRGSLVIDPLLSGLPRFPLPPISG